MRLLVVTQAVDRTDPSLGFFSDWLAAFAARVDRLTVICLYEGPHDLPANVTVHSLGKERGPASQAGYAMRFLALAWRLRRDYDAVFVHMNQEYVLLAGVLWKLLGTPVTLWRNHARGSFLTRVAIMLADAVFATSPQAYASRFRKAERMPVGIDAKPAPSVVRDPRALLYVGRIDPVKRLDIVIEALALVRDKGHEFVMSFVGESTAGREAYAGELRKLVQDRDLGARVAFLPPVPHTDLPRLYAAHGITVNATPAGSYDKTILEAAAYGSISVACTDAYAADAPAECVFDGTAASLADALERLLALPERDAERLRAELQALAEHNSLSALIDTLVRRIGSLYTARMG